MFFVTVYVNCVIEVTIGNPSDSLLTPENGYTLPVIGSVLPLKESLNVFLRLPPKP